jgi:nitrilase
MTKIGSTHRVAIIQARPAYGDVEATVDLVEAKAAEARAMGAQLIAFGETFLPGYPAWLDHCPGAALWDHEPTKEVFADLRANSVCVPGPITARLSEIARQNEVVMVVGAHERIEKGPGHGTLFNTLLTFDSSGDLVNHHRKLVPTYTERLLWGSGDGEGLRAPQTSCGSVGGLVCWEHWMPLARQALHNEGEQVHIAAWPTVHEMHHVASRHYAFEGRCFVLASGSILAARDLPSALELPEPLRRDPSQLVMRGGSAIIAPDGRYLAGPVYDTVTILVADLDLREIDRESMTLDTTGHSYRDDVFGFEVHRKR